MKLIFLLPPSEGKNPDGNHIPENLTFSFEKPIEIAQNATEKDLKCTGDRFAEAIFLNKNIQKSVTLPAMLRYNGVMFSAIGYENFSLEAKQFFDENFVIISGMYGIIKSKDRIGNYKLPASTKGLYDFWGTQILEKIIALKPDYIVNLLSGEYEKFFKFAKNENRFAENHIKIINVNFYKNDGKKISHGVKSIKGRFIAEICESLRENFVNQDFEKITENIWEGRKIQ